MSYFNLERLRKYGYDYGECCAHCEHSTRRLGINPSNVNWCIGHDSQINHTFKCNKFKRYYHDNMNREEYKQKKEKK